MAEWDICQSDINSEKGRLSNVNQQAYGEQTDGVQNITNTYRHTQVIGYYGSGGGVHVLRVCVRACVRACGRARAWCNMLLFLCDF